MCTHFCKVLVGPLQDCVRVYEAVEEAAEDAYPVDELEVSVSVRPINQKELHIVTPS
jgi:hypothetical protein